MSLPDSSLFASKPFTFIVQGKPLYVHSALVAECSELLNRMISGHLSEAQQGFAILDEVDEETFLRFIRWTYNGDYPAREHSVLKPEEKEDEKAEDPAAAIVDQLEWPTTYEDNFDAWGDPYTPYKTDKKKKKKTPELTLREAFINQHQDTRCSSRPSIPRARANTGPKEDYTEVFLGHARVYVFADKFDIQPLKQLALQKLHHQLAIHTLYIQRVGEITTLLKYVYANTMAPITSIHEEAGIRAMLAHYVRDGDGDTG